MEIPKFHNQENKPVWEYPEDSALFMDWYVDQQKISEPERSEGYKTFLKKVEEGKACHPTDEVIARYKIDNFR